MLKSTEEILSELKNHGYKANFYIEERDYPTTGPYTAYCIEILKDGKSFWRHSSRKSYQFTAGEAYEILKIRADIK